MLRPAASSRLRFVSAHHEAIDARARCRTQRPSARAPGVPLYRRTLNGIMTGSVTISPGSTAADPSRTRGLPMGCGLPQLVAVPFASARAGARLNSRLMSISITSGFAPSRSAIAGESRGVTFFWLKIEVPSIPELNAIRGNPDYTALRGYYRNSLDARSVTGENP